MAKGSQQQQPSQGLGADVIQLLEQLDRHCLAPDGSYVSKASYSDLLLAREEMSRERTRYLEAMALYYEVIAMVEEHQQLQCGGSLGGPRDTQGLYPQPGSMGSQDCFQVFETLERHLVTAEAAQRLRLPLLSRDGEVHDEDIAKWSGISRSSFESSSTTATMDSCSNAISYSSSLTPNIAVTSNDTDFGDVCIGGVPNCFLGITPKFLWQVQEKHVSLPLDITEYHNFLACEIESRLEIKCDKLAEVLQLDEIDSSSLTRIPSTRLPERLKLFIEDIEKEETILLEDLYSMDRKFAEHYNVLEQVLGVLIKFVKDLKLHHQHQYDELRKTWLCKRCQTMNAKLRVLEYLLLRDTYTKDSVEALHRIRKYLLEATEEAAIAYNKAVTRLREYQGVDPHFDTIARKYHEAVQKLNNIQWTIHQVEMDLQRSLDLS